MSVFIQVYSYHIHPVMKKSNRIDPKVPSNRCKLTDMRVHDKRSISHPLYPQTVHSFWPMSQCYAFTKMYYIATDCTARIHIKHLVR